MLKKVLDKIVDMNCYQVDLLDNLLDEIIKYEVQDKENIIALCYDILKEENKKWKK